MSHKFYNKTLYLRLMESFPGWPLTYVGTKSFIIDINDNYSVVEACPELIPCNIKYAGVIIKKRMLIDVIDFLKINLRRNEGKN